LSQSKLDINQQSDRLSLWGIRLLLASLLLLGGEILLWNNPQTHDPLEWLLRFVGYVLSATVLLDLAVRYRIRNLYDVMTLIVVHVLLVALLIQPDVAFDAFPSKLIQRMMGGVGFVSIEIFGVFLLMTRASLKRGRPLLIAYAIAVGFYWGIWVRWAPLRDGSGIQPTTFNIMLAYFGVIGLIAFLLFLRMSRRHSVWEASHLQLDRRELGVVLIVSVLLFLIRFVQGIVDFGGLAVFIVLMALVIGVLVYRKPQKARMLMDNHFPPQPIQWLWMVIASVVVVGSAFVGYSLPFIELDFVNQLWILELAFLGIGGLWLPLIAVVFSTEAIDRQSRTMRQ
jgi:hypothetical protein